MPDFKTGVPAGAQIGLADITTTVPARRGQQFRNYQVPNLQLALYQLQIRGPGSDNSLKDSYTFPLSPESVRKEFDALANYYDVQGDAANNGVQRIFDIYGHTPATFIIEGTTGWQLHGTDGYKYTGLQSISRIESLLSTYAQLNQIQISNGNSNMYQLWFFDFFRNEYWQVVPIGKQGIRQSVSRPQLVNYVFNLVGARRLDAADAQAADTLAQLLSSSNTEAARVLENAATQLLGRYTTATPVAK